MTKDWVDWIYRPDLEPDYFDVCPSCRKGHHHLCYDRHVCSCDTCKQIDEDVLNDLLANEHEYKDTDEEE